MSKLKEKIFNLYEILKKSVEKFPLTVIPILVLTLIYMINIDNDFLSSKTLGNITVFITIFSSGAFLIETLKDGNIKDKFIYYVISGIIGLIFTWGINIETGFLWMEKDIFLWIRRTILY